MDFFIFFCVLGLILLGVFLGTGYFTYLIRHSHVRKNVNKTKEVKLLSVLGSGGHTTEMIELLSHLGPQYNNRTYVLADTDKMSENKVMEHEKAQSAGKFAIERIPRSREVGQNYVSSVPSTIYATFFALKLVKQVNPDVVLVNGPGTCIPIAFMAALLDMLRLTDVKIIYVESLCRVHTLSLSAALLYYTGLADSVVVQWKELKEKYPRTKLIEELPQ